MIRAGLLNFSKGALAPALWGRIDVAAYSAALRVADNVTVLKYGGVTRRMGQRFVYELIPPEDGWTDADPSARLIPFEYSIEQTYMLVFSQATMHAAVLGGMVLEEGLKVTGATNTNPVIITAAYHAFEDGDEVFFRDVEGMTELNGRTMPVTVVDASHFSVPLDGREYGVYTGDTTGIVRVAPPAPPPPPPPVPPPVPDPTPPDTTPPGGTHHCVIDTTPIMVPNDRRDGLGDVVLAKRLRRGDYVWTRPILDDGTLGPWGAFEVENISFAVEEVYHVKGGYPPATRRHRFWVKDGFFAAGTDLGGARIGSARVAKITVKEARTYASQARRGSRIFISHNIKDIDGGFL